MSPWPSMAAQPLVAPSLTAALKLLPLPPRLKGLPLLRPVKKRERCFRLDEVLRRCCSRLEGRLLSCTGDFSDDAVG